MRLRDHVVAAARVLADAGVPSPERDARELAAYVLGEPRYPVPEPDDLPGDFADEYAEVVARRAAREPLQYVVGTAAFRTLAVQVGAGVFVPRPETEVVAQVAIDAAARRVAEGTFPSVVDLCAGSGAIALSVAVEVRAARVVAVEKDSGALAWLRRNVEALPSAVRRRVEVVEGDVADPALLARLNTTVDVVVSNPPYVPPHEAPLQPEAKHDPSAALYGGGGDGLEVPRAVMRAGARLLSPGGNFVMEHSSSQGDAARAALEDTGGFAGIGTLPDLAGLDRMVIATRAGGAARSAADNMKPRCGL